MPRDEKLEHLANVRLFAALNKKELALVGKAADVVDVPAGETIVTEGTVGHEFYLILDGTATVKRKGRKVASLKPGDYFGELSLLDHGPRSATITTDTPAELAVIGQREFLGVLDQVPSVSVKLLSTMAGRLREADTRAYSH
jgi:CRP/FNR family transcriptional regulator, cyclic AMP receptor protein